jgi:hypothetical protein
LALLGCEGKGSGLLYRKGQFVLAGSIHHSPRMRRGEQLNLGNIADQSPLHQLPTRFLLLLSNANAAVGAQVWSDQSEKNSTVYSRVLDQAPYTQCRRCSGSNRGVIKVVRTVRCNLYSLYLFCDIICIDPSRVEHFTLLTWRGVLLSEAKRKRNDNPYMDFV